MFRLTGVMAQLPEEDRELLWTNHNKSEDTDEEEFTSSDVEHMV